MPRALVITTGVAGLADKLARAVEAEVLVKAPLQTTAELRRAVVRAAMAADPAAADLRREQAQKQARVERWAEPAGTGSIAGRDLPPAEVIAAENRINALAAALKSDGAAGGMDLLRAQVFLDLLLGRPAAAPALGLSGDPASELPGPAPEPMPGPLPAPGPEPAPIGSRRRTLRPSLSPNLGPNLGPQPRQHLSPRPSVSRRRTLRPSLSPNLGPQPRQHPSPCPL